MAKTVGYIALGCALLGMAFMLHSPAASAAGGPRIELSTPEGAHGLSDPLPAMVPGDSVSSYVNVRSLSDASALGLAVAGTDLLDVSVAGCSVDFVDSACGGTEFDALSSRSADFESVLLDHVGGLSTGETVHLKVTLFAPADLAEMPQSTLDYSFTAA